MHNRFGARCPAKLNPEGIRPRYPFKLPLPGTFDNFTCGYAKTADQAFLKCAIECLYIKLFLVHIGKNGFPLILNGQ